jgi:large subunit ribosomal protein L33
MVNKKKSSKKKRPAILFKLVSTAKTGYYYLARRNPRKRPDKMEFMKYDPKVKKHVLFKEQKLSS